MKMYNRLIRYLKDDLELFDEEDCQKVKELLEYLNKTANIPVKLIQANDYEDYIEYCIKMQVIPMNTWQFDLCKCELNWK